MVGKKKKLPLALVLAPTSLGRLLGGVGRAEGEAGSWAPGGSKGRGFRVYHGGAQNQHTGERGIGFRAVLGCGKGGILWQEEGSSGGIGGLELEES
ncbi:hypothetical protein JTE90_007363 [Oedothorax gibbosus]|uniref:Uncharacterized protein n=1 Tax=Oedothorax gibbosus TaxID=931172 RepID=A0AAV6TDG9_9ARAC|nr:hypothetical protein JTE90_007363 [Oedothorax gibbosus]